MHAPFAVRAQETPPVDAPSNLAASMQAADPDSAAPRASGGLDGGGASYWGVIAAPSDSNTARFASHPPPAWNAIVDVPYYVVGFPLRAFSAGAGVSIVYLEKHRVLYKIGRLLRPRELPYGVLVGFSAGGLTGFGTGLTFVHDQFLGPDNRLRFGARTSRNGHHRVVLGTRFAVDHPSSMQIGAGYRMTPNARFFGIGPASRTAENEESFFRQELVWVGGTYEHKLASSVSGFLDARYTSIGARGPREEDEPSIATAFADSLPRGYRQRSHGVSLGFGLNSNSAKTTGRPSSGGFHRAAVSYYLGAEPDEDPSFWSYRLESQWFIPLWKRTRTLALRGFYSWIDPVAGGSSGDIPFQRLMTNDDPDLLRGYDDFRWRDLGMVAFTAEYRWPVWAFWKEEGAGIDAYVFTDIGQVFGDHDEVNVDNLTESYGFGFRLLGAHGFTGRLEYGWSEDEHGGIRLRADQTFQFQDGDLFHGRNPVPSR